MLCSLTMSVTGSAFTAEHSQIQRLVNSEVLHGSESLCKLLRYLAERAIEFPGVPAKEYQIATEVFGRRPNFDARLDSAVRVQTGRLRSKLADYYADQGKDDPIIVEIPRGIYMVNFVHREAAIAEARASDAPSSAGATSVAEQTAPARPPSLPNLANRHLRFSRRPIADFRLHRISHLSQAATVHISRFRNIVTRATLAFGRSSPLVRKLPGSSSAMRLS